MTRDECVLKYKHSLWGIMLDVTRTGATGSLRAAMEDQAMRKIDALIGAIWNDCQPHVPIPQANGAAKPAERIAK